MTVLSTSVFVTAGSIVIAGLVAVACVVAVAVVSEITEFIFSEVISVSMLVTVVTVESGKIAFVFLIARLSVSE